MFVTIADEVLNHVLSQGQHSSSDIQGYLFGRVLDGGDVVQITHVGDLYSKQEPVGLWGAAGDPDRLQIPSKGSRDRILLLVLPELQAIQCYTESPMGWQAVEFDVLQVYEGVFRRLQGLFDTRYLVDKTVAVIGLGTGGGLAALELAKNGVGHFRLVDFDRLKVHNVARHVCGLSDVGRYKTRALADMLRNACPRVQVETFEFNVLEDPEQLYSAVKGSDLVIGATDSEKSKRAINDVCWPMGIPAVYGAAYDRAFGGDVVRVIPPATACYECFYSQITEIFETAPRKGNLDYTSDVSKAVAEPGLGIDVAFIGLILTKMALLTLLRGSESTLEDLPSDFVMWGNRPIWVFEKPLESLFFHISPNPICPVCRSEAYALESLGMNQDKVKEAVKELMEEVDAAGTFTLPQSSQGALTAPTSNTVRT